MRKMFLSLCLAFAVLLPGAALAGDIKIGVMAPLTGSFVSEGEDMRDIVLLLADELNKSGGINGRKVEIVVQDDGSDARSAAQAAQRLSSSGVCAVIGTYGSAVTEASQLIYDRRKILQIGTGSTSIRLTEQGYKLFFRTCPRDDEQGRVAADVLKRMNFKKVAIVHDNSAYAKGLADEAQSLLKKESGIEIVFFDAIQPKERDYNAALTKIRSSAPDVILFTGYYPEAGMLLRQMREMKWSVPMIGGDATNNTDLVKIGGLEAVAGYHFVSPAMPGDLGSQMGRDFVAAYEARYGRTPSSVWSVLAGDAFKVIVEAIKAKGTDSKAMADYLRNDLKDFEGLTGKISFNEKGDRVGELYRLYMVNEKGEFVLLP